MWHYLQVIDFDWEKATRSTTTTQNQNDVIGISRPRENDAKNDAFYDDSRLFGDFRQRSRIDTNPR